MKTYTKLELIFKLEKSIDAIIKDADQNRWDENTISSRLAQLFAKQLNNIKITDQIPGSNPISIKCNVYENKKGTRGSDENKFGDIGIYVKIKKHGIEIEGVSFLEAKRSSKTERTNVFKEIKLDQMKRIFENAPYSFLLLYDYKKIIIPGRESIFLDDKLPFLLSSSTGQFERLPVWFNQSYSFCTTVPLNLAIKLNIKSRELCRFSSFLTFQILNRFFNGYDLNFNPELVKIAKGYSKNIQDNKLQEFESPRYSFFFMIGGDEVEANPEVYQRINGY